MAERRMSGGSKGISIQKDHGYVCICINCLVTRGGGNKNPMEEPDSIIPAAC